MESIPSSSSPALITLWLHTMTIARSSDVQGRHISIVKMLRDWLCVRATLPFHSLGVSSTAEEAWLLAALPAGGCVPLSVWAACGATAGAVAMHVWGGSLFGTWSPVGVTARFCHPKMLVCVPSHSRDQGLGVRVETRSGDVDILLVIFLALFLCLYL